MNGGVLLVWRGATPVLIANEQIFWLYFFNSHVQNIHTKKHRKLCKSCKVIKRVPNRFFGIRDFLCLKLGIRDLKAK